MARYDTGALFDTGVVYDATLGTLTATEAVLAGESTALPDRRIPWRDAAATIWAFDPVAWLPTEQVENVAITATRSGTLSATGRQTETLTFDFAAALPFVNPFGMSEGDWFCVRWHVTTPTDSTAFLGGVFRLNSVPSSVQDDAGITFHCEAVDWFSYITELIVSPSGWIAVSEFIALSIAYFEATGQVFSNDPAGFCEGLAAYIWYYAASGHLFNGHIAPFHVEAWYWASIPSIADTSTFRVIGGAFQITSPGQPCRIRNVLDWFWPLVAGYTLAYHADGGLSLTSRVPADSGLYVTLGTTPLGSVPLPAEAAPLTLVQPSYTAVLYSLFFTPPPPPILGRAPGGVSPVFGAASSLHWSGFGGRFEQIIDMDQPVTLGGFESATAWCEWRLQGYLGAAQTIALTVDSCFPVPPLGRLVAIELVDGDPSWPRSGWYRLTSFTQPLHTGPATWTLSWWSAL
jgi:hypothetical protein